MPPTLDERVQKLEQEVERISSRLRSTDKSGWLEHVAGSFADDEAFAEIVRLGKEWRDKVNRESLEEN